jgi:hypothetical protein
MKDSGKGEVVGECLRPGVVPFCLRPCLNISFGCCRVDRGCLVS